MGSISANKLGGLGLLVDPGFAALVFFSGFYGPWYHRIRRPEKF